MPGDDSTMIRQLFAAALQRDPEERDDYLNQACVDRPDLRARVAALLSAQAQDLLDPPQAGPDEATRLQQTPVAPAVAPERRRIGPYVIWREIGRGGMGVVYLADDTRLQRRVALKAINQDASRTPGLRERLRHEARVAAGLSHPGIATVYALEEIDGQLYMACEFVPGAPLRTLVEAGPLPIAEVVRIGVQVARALAQAHTMGIVHRDLKPENVIKTPSGVVKILDFGLAREEYADQRLTQSGLIVGTPAYLAPEQALAQHQDFRTDLFEMGVLLYELASGRNPFVASSVTATIARILGEDPPPLSRVQPNSVPQLDNIIQKCLKKAPADRYGSTQELIDDLERLQADLDLHRPSASMNAAEPQPTPRVATPLRWMVMHQIVLSIVYVGMLYPAWHASRWLPQPWNMVFLLGVLASAAAATSLRLHLWFTASNFPQRLAAEQSMTWMRTRWCDVAFAVAQIAGALAFGGAHPEFAMLFVGVAIAVLVAAFVIEPATAAAALNDRGGTP